MKVLKVIYKCDVWIWALFSFLTFIRIWKLRSFKEIKNERFASALSIHFYSFAEAFHWHYDTLPTVFQQQNISLLIQRELSSIFRNQQPWEQLYVSNLWFLRVKSVIVHILSDRMSFVDILMRPQNAFRLKEI